MTPTSSRDRRILQFAAKSKRIVAAVLLVLMFLVVAVGAVELIVLVIREIIRSAASGDWLASTSGFILSEEALLGVFGLFLNVLIALELTETVEVYFRDHSLHAEIVILVAIIAVARKAILLDLSYYEPMTIVGLAALIVALAGAYYLVKGSGPRVPLVRRATSAPDITEEDASD